MAIEEELTGRTADRVQGDLVNGSSMVIDHNHPLYLSSSDVPGALSVGIQLTGMENYTLWSRAMEIALFGQNKVGFINGSVLRTDFDGALKKIWDRCNTIVISWLTCNVSKDLLSGILYSSSANRVWLDLKERFDKVNGYRLYQLHRIIFTLTKGTSANRVWLDLKERFDKAYALIIQDESQKGIVGSVHKGMESLALYTARNIRSPQPNSREDDCFQLIGYPENFKGKKKVNAVMGDSAMQKPMPFMQDQLSWKAHTVVGEKSHPDLSQMEDHMGEQLTHYQLLQMLNKSSPAQLNQILNVLQGNNNTMNTQKSAHMAAFEFNLLSVNKLTKELNCYVSFFPTHCVFQDLLSGKVKGIGEVEDGLYVLNWNTKQHQNRIKSLSAVGSGERDPELWHKRLGHMEMDFFIALKSDVNVVLRQFLIMIMTQFGKSVKVFRSAMSANVSECTDSLLCIDDEHNVLDQHVNTADVGVFPAAPVSPHVPIIVSDNNLILQDATRRSNRSAKPSLWHTDYMLTQKKTVVSYFISDEAMHDPRWVAAMQSETQALKDNHTWRIVQLPKDKKAIGCKWIYKIKYKVDDEVDRFKARLVAKGYNQKEGLDYQETFSHVVRMGTIRAIIALAATHNWPIQQMDIFNAFFQGDLYEEVYMTLPLGFVHKRNDHKLILQTKGILKDNFEIKDLGDLRYFLGIEFAKNDTGILMHQRKYCLELISDMGLSSSRPVGAPIEINHKLTIVEFDMQFPSENENDKLLDDPRVYQKLVGKLFYLTMTKPDTVFAVQLLSQFMHSPKTSHMKAAIRVVRYVKQSLGLGILMSSNATDQLTTYCDADWAACPNNRRSITGYMVTYGDSLISWE
ncbi:uncharacterized protein LOC125877559 [Solanum stenotomum]|uniref:uncharacterized protein LOC125877559 n=1 Tax=Solanum stenotomum TaxID=172797 RepID=UPI0020D1EF9F|nr:uncharacterized protein LOC125877559 [Solanum stenotomum]